MASHDVLPHRSKSKRGRSSNSIPARSPDHTANANISQTLSNSAPRSTRPSLASRTSSAPLLPAIKVKTPNLLSGEDEGGLDQYSIRDSVASIKDDPFFRNYQTPNSISLARELRSATYSERMRDGKSPHEPPPPSPNRTALDNSVNLPPQSRSGMSDINIAVIGSSGVGKSTLIQRALGLRSSPTSIASSQRMSVDNVVYTVSLIELDLESFDIVPDRRIQWPKQINGHIVPRMDGALLLYDVMNSESIQELPQTLNGLMASNLPTILVSCKCDNPENTRQVSVETMEDACSSCVEAVKTASNVPESARLCLSSMLKAIMASRNAANSAAEITGARRRATSSANLEAPPDPSRPLSQHSKHSRASSEYSLLRGFPSPPPVMPRGTQSRPNGRTNLQHQFNLSLPDPHEAPPLSSHPMFRHDGLQTSSDSSSNLAPGASSRSPLPSPMTGRAVDNSFLDMEESDGDGYRYSDDIPILERNDDSFFDKPAKVAGVTFDELVDRLLGQNMSRADNNFSDIFLCLYRKFAAPGELFGAIEARLDRIAEDKNTHYLTRTATQLRIITVVAKWVTTYPGDFASPMTSAKLDTFISGLAGEPVFAAAAQEMRTQLQSRVIEDDDTGWARTDADVEVETGNTVESAPASPVRRRTDPRDLMEEEDGGSHMDEEGDEEMERKESRVDSSISGRADSPNESLAPSFHTVEDYEREAASMVPKGNLPLTKFRYHIFMDTSDDDFADEMTRIDWVMFSSIRLRDLVRHVSLPLEQKEKCKSLANVNRMINHFNHVAKWVANMILMRDKAKHRALMLEKFMTIALKLRQLNNYNGLAAVLAGINGSAIHRLAQTRALVPAEVQKRFARLVILMGTQKSHFAYRLAWENSSLPRIPFIPLHRRDLVSAEEGSRTFVGAKAERINWKKFEVLSEVILPIMKSQVVPYPNLSKHDISRELILDCRMPVDDEEIYQRSLQLESTSGSVEFAKKKFPWFQKEK
ncbi:ras guanine nucleotide exchange factor domain-containing protein [Hyaloscypha sp. PMI_1271]|nr:ras guanine nucleotide exchange factor domain-containing protein [Hyaloscypha sp. PMI_1271]